MARSKKPRGPRAPRGFKPIGVTNAREAADLTKERLKETLDNLPGYNGRIRVHVNKDGTMDGELVLDIPRGVKSRRLYLDIESAFQKQGLAREFWFSAGQRFVIKEDDEIYRRYKGMNDVRTFYTRINQTNVAKMLLAARDTMSEGMERKYKRKAENVYIRIHWNKDGSKPERGS